MSESRSVGSGGLFGGAAAQVSTNLFVRDLDLLVAPHDARRLEVVADGLPEAPDSAAGHPAVGGSEHVHKRVTMCTRTRRGSGT